jgi:hypothetical protein
MKVGDVGGSESFIAFSFPKRFHGVILDLAGTSSVGCWERFFDIKSGGFADRKLFAKSKLGGLDLPSKLGGLDLSKLRFLSIPGPGPKKLDDDDFSLVGV